MQSLHRTVAVALVALLLGSVLLAGPQGPSSEATADVDHLEADVEAGEATSPGPEELEERVAQALPTRFETNQGQAPEDALFVARTAGGSLLVERDGLVLQGEAGAARITFPGADPSEVVGEGSGPRTHYYTDNDPSAWLKDVPGHQGVRLVEAYPGIDILVYAIDGGIEFDHVIAPGADASSARFQVQGADQVQHTDGGGLQITAGGSSFRLQAPYAYQEGPAGQEEVDAAFRLHDDGLVVYALAPFDPTRTLIIDPAIKYSSYLGTTSTDYVRGVRVVDPPAPFPTDERVVYVGGYSLTATAYPSGFPSGSTSTHGGGGGYQAFVARFVYDLATSELTPEWFVYYGGSSTEYLYDLDALPDGTVAFGGYTASINLPVNNEVMLTDPNSGTVIYDGGVKAGTSADAYVAILDDSGGLTMSTYLGSATIDYIYGVALASSDRVAIAGYANSPGTAPTYPTTPGAFMAAPVGLAAAPFVSLIDVGTPASEFVFSTYVDGGNADYPRDIAVDSSGVYFVGDTSYNTVSCGIIATYCTLYPTTPGAFQNAPVVDPSSTATTFIMGFATKLDLDGNMVYSTFLDGGGSDYASSVSVAPNGSIWVGGRTASTDFPVCPDVCSAPALHSTNPGSTSAYALNLADDGGSVHYGTYFGSSSLDYEGNARLAANGDVLLSLYTAGTGLAQVNAPLSTKPGGSDTYVARLDPTTGTLRLATWYGGTAVDYIYRGNVDTDDKGNLYLGGYTTSTTTASGFPIHEAVQSTGGGGSDGYLAIIGKKPPQAIIEANGTGQIAKLTPTLNAQGFYVHATSAYEVLTGVDVDLDGSMSADGDFPRDPSQDEWELYDGSTLLATDTGTSVPSFSPLNLPTAGSREVCLTVTDTDPDPNAHDRTSTSCLEIKWKNRKPVADFDALPWVLSAGNKVQFTDLSTDLDGSIAQWSWDFDDGGTSASQHPEHTFMQPGLHNVTLKVTDDLGATRSVTHQVEVELGPAAYFTTGPSPHRPDTPVLFDDHSTHGELPISTWKWDFGDGKVENFGAGGPPQSLPHAYATPGQYTVNLTVSDGKYDHTYSRNLTVELSDPAPQPDTYMTMQGVKRQIDAPGVLGNDLHPNGYPLKVVSTTQPQNGVVTCGSVLAVCADGSFTYDPVGYWNGQDTFQYSLSDGINTIGPVTVTMVVSESPPPQARIGIEVVGHEVRFHDQSKIGYHPLVDWGWHLAEAGSNSDRHPVATYSEPGHRLVRLTVTDAAGLSDTAYAGFYITGEAGQPERHSDPPSAKAGEDRNAVAGDAVLLDGRDSGPDGADMHHEWRQLTGPSVRLRDHGATTSFQAPDVPRGQPLDMVFQLRVYDGVMWSPPDLVTITVSDRNLPPVAVVAVPYQSVQAGSLVTMDATGSHDPEGDPLEFTWVQTDGPKVALGQQPDPTFQVPLTAQDATLRFRLEVSDGSAVDTADVVVRVAGSGPMARFVVGETDRTGSVAFLDKSLGQDALAYEWDFGDGSPPSHRTEPVHSYAQSGTYLVRLVVQDGDGRFDTFGRHVHAVVEEDEEVKWSDADVAEQAPEVPDAGGSVGEDAAPPAGAPAHATPMPGVALLLVALGLALRRRR